MKNFVQPGNNLEVAAPADVLSGAPFIIGSLFLVAVGDALSGVQVNATRVGVFELPKLGSDVVVAGVKMNWNDSNKELQLATTDLDDVVTAVEAADGSVSLVKVVLTPL